MRGLTTLTVPEVGFALMVITGAVFGGTTVTVAEPETVVLSRDDVQLIGKFVVESILEISCEPDAPVELVQFHPGAHELGTTLVPVHEMVESPPELTDVGAAETTTLAPTQEFAITRVVVEVKPEELFGP